MSGVIDNAQSFPPAPMSASIKTLTVLIYAVTMIIVISALLGAVALIIPAVAIFALYAWVWLRFRPSGFTIRAGRLEVEWPLRHIEFPIDDIVAARLLDRTQLKSEIGWGLRIGAGGLWGGFGRLWTKHRGLIHMYITRTDHFVWIERKRGKPWLITPDRAEEFIDALDRIRARAAEPLQ